MNVHGYELDRGLTCEQSGVTSETVDGQMES
jgi:hypothetical protein